MHKILSGQSVTDAAAGTTLVDPAEGTAAESLVGWLAVGRAATLSIWLEVEPSRSRSDASRDLEAVEKIELDGRALSLAACPRCKVYFFYTGSGIGDDLLIAMDSLSWELVRLRPTELPQRSAIGRRRIGIDLSVVASGHIGSGPRGSLDATSRTASSEMALRLDVRGPSLEKGAREEQSRGRKQHGIVKTLVACACGSAITLLTFFCDTTGGQDRSQPGNLAELTSTSVTVPLTSAADGTPSRSEASTKGPGNPHNYSSGRQSHTGFDNTGRQDTLPLTMLSGASAVRDLVILSGERHESLEPAGNGNSPARDIYSPAIIALLLIDEGRRDGGGRVACSDRTNGGQQAKIIRTFRWDLSGGGGGTLRPGHWCLANLHPDTCIAVLATGGLLCVDPDGVKAFTEDGVPLLDVGRNTRGRDVTAAIPRSTRGSWGANARLVAVTRFHRESRRREPNHPRFCGVKDHSGTREDFLVADISGQLHRVSVSIGCSVRDSGDGTCPEEEVANNRHCCSRSVCGRIECNNLGLRFGNVPYRLHHHLRLLLPVGSTGLVFAVTGTSPFPVVVSIPLVSPPRSMLPTRVGKSVHSAVEDDRAKEGATHKASWQLLEGWDDGPNLGPVSGMIVLPGPRSDEKEPTWSDGTTKDSRKARIPAHTQPGHMSSSAIGVDRRDDEPGTLKRVRPRGLRVALATGTMCPSDASARNHGSANDPANSLGILEHGLRLETTVEGSIGLPVGATLLAQPLPVGHAGRPKVHGCRQLRGNDRKSSSDRRHREKERADDSGETGHVLLLSDRVRSRTHVMFKFSSGDVAPATTAAAMGFDCNLHTIHLGRLEPLGYILQVTPDSVNIVRSSAWSEASESVASWRPPPPPSPCASFKVQHAGTAGTAVVVACESTMVLIDVRDAAPAAAAVVDRTRRTVDGAGAQKPVPTRKITAREVRRVEVDGGPVSAMSVRSHGNDTPEEGTGMSDKPAAPVLIAIASWDSPAIIVYSFSAWATATSARNQTAPQRDRQTRDELNDDKGLLKIIATWHPPWGGSLPPLATGDSSTGGADPATAAGAAETRRESKSATLTRALAFVQFGREPERMSVVAATADGAVAVGEWQQGSALEGSGEDNSTGYGGPRGQQTTVSCCSGVALVTVASFQVGQGPVRLVVFRAAGRAESADAIGDGNGVQKVLVNGEMMDAVVHRCWEAPAPDQSSGGWQCTQALLVLTDISPPIRRSKGVPIRMPPPGESRPPAATSNSALRIYDADTLEERPGTAPLRLLPGVRVTGMALLPGLARVFGRTAATSTAAAAAAAQVKPEVDRRSRTPAIPAEAAAVGGDVIAVACCSLANGAPTKLAKSGQESAGDGGVGRHGNDDEGRTPTSAMFSRSHVAPSRNASATECAAFSDEPVPFCGQAARTVTVLAAFEVVACGNDGAVAADDGKDGSDGTPHCTTEDAGVKVNERPRQRGPQVSTNFDGHGSTALMALAASPEMAGACFSVEALGKRSVVVSNDDRVVVFGWEGFQEGLRPDEPAPPLKLRAQASCRTPGGRCVTALATCTNFVAVAEFLHSVCLYRFDETVGKLCLVAKHTRESLMVTALELSVRPVFPPAPCTVEEGSEESMVALLAVADLTTGTIAVLACPRLAFPFPGMDIVGSTETPLTNSSTNGGSTCGGGGIDSGEGANGMTRSRSRSGSVSSSDRGNSSEGCTSDPRTTDVGSHDRDVAPLGLVSVWPCHAKVMTLTSQSDFPPDDGGDDVNVGGDRQGEQRQQQQQQQQHPQPRDSSVRLPLQASAYWGFLAGTASGAVLAGRVGVPRRNPVS